jgi:nucleoside-diphosphate-sugar epimerase
MLGVDPDGARRIEGGGLGTLPAMEVLAIGGHGKVGLRLLRPLARDGHRGRGVTRKAEQASDLAAADAEAVLCDLERGDDLRPHVGAADAIVFAASRA